jgi:hypothetical protein
MAFRRRYCLHLTGEPSCKDRIERNGGRRRKTTIVALARKLLVEPCSRLQHLQRPTPSNGERSLIDSKIQSKLNRLHKSRIYVGPATASSLNSGLQDGVDYHWWELFKAAALSTLLSVGSEAGNSGNESDIAWVSTLEIQYPVDFEMANHFTATHPASRFVNGILASAVTTEGRVNVMNRDVTVLRGRTAEKSTLPHRLALRVLLAKHFGFDLPEAETMRVPSV